MEEQDIKHYEQADLITECGCGHTTVISTNIVGGIIMPTTDQVTIQGTCEKCENSLTIKFVEAANPIEKVEENGHEDADIIEEVTNEENKEEGPVQGSDRDSE